jgi:hypothetical protein
MRGSRGYPGRGAHTRRSSRLRWGYLLVSLLLVALAACDLNPVPFPTQPPDNPTGTPAMSPAVSGSRQPEGTTPSTPETRPCSRGDLQLVAGWLEADGVMQGAVTLINKSTTSCTLEGRPGIHLLDAGGRLMPVANLDLPAGTGSVELPPGDKAFVRFTWSNWCGSASGPYSVAVALPGRGGQVNVPGLDPQGRPLDITPRCDDANVSSTISVAEFQK